MAALENQILRACEGQPFLLLFGLLILESIDSALVFLQLNVTLLYVLVLIGSNLFEEFSLIFF